MTPAEARLVRSYNRRLNIDSMKKRVLGSAITLGIYTRGLNDDSPLQDAFDALMRFNDNDIFHAAQYKAKKLRQFNPEELADIYQGELQQYKLVDVNDFTLLNEETGEIIEYSSLTDLQNGGGQNDDKTNL